MLCLMGRVCVLDGLLLLLLLLFKDVHNGHLG